jgi:enolase
MVIINGVTARSIPDSRDEKTILISIKTDKERKFSATSPNGKSRGKYEKKPYKNSLEDDIKTIKKFNDYFSDEDLEKFEDLRRVEDICEGHVGANTIFALESAILKALAHEHKKEVWELINPETKKKKFPRLVGNCIGGGKHSKLTSGRKPDFQEFLLIPKTRIVKEAFETNKKIRERVGEELKRTDEKFSEKVSDEKGWTTSLNEKEVLEILKKMKIPLGIDIASSSFYKRKMYLYQNPMLKRDQGEQLNYLSNLIKNFNLFYIEDPFEEEDFESFSLLLKKFPDSLIVGDDLTVTNHKRLEKAIEKKSINGIIVKPNQCGSLIEVKDVCELAKKNNIKTIFSHRSGETEENILADLAFGFQADFLKCGIVGRERESKIRRLIEIEKNL